jgi:hypothetical protein
VRAVDGATLVNLEVSMCREHALSTNDMGETVWRRRTDLALYTAAGCKDGCFWLVLVTAFTHRYCGVGGHKLPRCLHQWS